MGINRAWTRKSIEEIFWELFRRYGKPPQVTGKPIETRPTQEIYRSNVSVGEAHLYRISFNPQARAYSYNGDVVLYPPQSSRYSAVVAHIKHSSNYTYANSINRMVFAYFELGSWAMPYLWYFDSQHSTIYKFKKASGSYPYEVTALRVMNSSISSGNISGLMYNYISEAGSGWGITQIETLITSQSFYNTNNGIIVSDTNLSEANVIQLVKYFGYGVKTGITEIAV